MPETTCVLCPIYRPGGEARYADTVCPADQARLHRDLLAVPGLYRQLAEGTPDAGDDRWYRVTGDDGAPTGELRRRDPVAAVLPAGATIAERSQRPQVSGSRDNPLLINVDAHDLTAPARAAAPLGDTADQIGHVAVATVLDGWARHVRDSMHPDFHLPPDDVAALVAFLDRHLADMIGALPADLPALAFDLRQLVASMRGVLGELEPVPQPLLGVRCEHCKKISTLVPWASGQYIECQACAQLYSTAERFDMARRQLAEIRRPRLVILNGLLPGMRPACG